MKKIKTLLVDDSPIDRRFSKFYLESIGLEVITAEDGFEALHQLNQNKFDMIFIDLIMPNLDGFSLITRINSQAELNNIPIIVLSSKSKTYDVEKAILLGVEDYIIKPINITKVKNKIKDKFNTFDFNQWKEVPISNVDQKAMVTISNSAEVVSISEMSLTLKSTTPFDTNSPINITSNFLKDLGINHDCELLVSSFSKTGQFYYTKVKFNNQSAEFRNNIHRLVKNNNTYASMV